MTVGSHTQTDSNITHNLSPSPFTRSGSLLDRIKPDLVASGGNFNTVVSNGRITNLDHNGHGIKLCNLNFSQPPNNPYTEECGTSFSAPIISSLASRLFQEYPESSIELIKSLIINSCILLKDQNNKEYDIDIQGHGRCSFNDTLYSNDYKVTLLSEQIITPAEVETNQKYKKLEKIYKIYVPRGATKMNVTLIFGNPSIEEFRGFLPIKFNLGCKRISSKHPRKPSRTYFKDIDNVIYKSYSIKRSFGEWEIRIKPQIKFLKQKYNVRYALVITLLDETYTNPLYEEIKSKSV